MTRAEARRAARRARLRRDAHNADRPAPWSEWVVEVGDVEVRVVGTRDEAIAHAARLGGRVRR